MARYHVNDEGNVGRCTAKAGNCRFGSESDHASSKEEARAKAEQQLEAIYSPLGQSKTKRPIDFITKLLFAKPLPIPRERKAPMPAELHVPYNENDHYSYETGVLPSSRTQQVAKEEKTDDHFSEFFRNVELANSESRPDRVKAQAAFDFQRYRVLNREIPVVDDNFKLYYRSPEINNSNLTLQGWEPENPTQDYIVKELATNVLAQHDLRLENDGITTNPFYAAFREAQALPTVQKPNNANQQLELVSDFSNGVVSGLIDATERAKNRKFSDEATEEGRKKELKKFLEEEAFLYESAYNNEQNDFNDGRSWIIEEWLNEL